MNHRPFHLLLVEDDDAHAMIVEKGFRATGASGTIDRVADGMEAVAYVKRQGEQLPCETRWFRQVSRDDQRRDLVLGRMESAAASIRQSRFF